MTTITKNSAQVTPAAPTSQQTPPLHQEASPPQPKIASTTTAAAADILASIPACNRKRNNKGNRKKNANNNNINNNNNIHNINNNNNNRSYINNNNSSHNDNISNSSNIGFTFIKNCVKNMDYDNDKCGNHNLNSKHINSSNKGISVATTNESMNIIHTNKKNSNNTSTNNALTNTSTNASNINDTSYTNHTTNKSANSSSDKVNHSSNRTASSHKTDTPHNSTLNNTSSTNSSTIPAIGNTNTSTSNTPRHVTMFESGGQVLQNLVIEVKPRGRHNSKRRVTVPGPPLERYKTGGTTSNSHQNHQQAIESNTYQSSTTNSNTSSTSSNNNNTANNKKDVTNAPKKEKSSLRHSYHPQQPSANGSSAPGKGSTNGSVASGKSATNQHSSGHNESGTRRSTTVSRERSFMRPQSHHAAYYSNYGGSSGAPAQSTQDPSSGGGSKGVAAVQRQRSCVANLYSSHGRSNSSSAMPAATAYQRPKPAMQLYRPPTLRVSDDYTMINGSYAYDVSNGIDSAFNKPGLNINAKEFVSLSSNGFGGYVTSSGGQQHHSNGHTNTVSFSGPNGATPSALKHSKSSSQVLLSSSNGRQNGAGAAVTLTGGLHHSRSGGVCFVGGSSSSKVANRDGRNNGSLAGGGSSPPLRVHFTDDTITYDPDSKVGMIQRSPTTSSSSSGSSGYLLSAAPQQIMPIKRSKSLGSAADLNSSSNPHHNGGGVGALLFSTGESAVATNAANAITDMAPFTEDVSSKLQQVLASPSTASARLVMEVVRQLFCKLVQGTRYAEPAARYCIAVIEKESGGETFLETLLNTCQEYYQERETLLRSTASVPSRPSAPPPTHTRWVAYMTFLHEMYTQVKRRQRTVVSSTGPGLLLLTLLAECVVVSLRDQAAGGASMTQTECLFFLLTGVGKDIELELPPLMEKVMGAARDALFASARAPAVRKTLLQLIEMNAASWQLPAPAVMYYYPGVSGK